LRSLFRIAHSVVFWILVVLYTVIISSVSRAIALFINGQRKKELFYERMSKLWGSLIFNASLVRVDLAGLENVPMDTNVVFTPNHQSYIDIFILLKYLPFRYKFIIMRKLFKVPFLGTHIARSGFLSLDRKDRKNSVKMIHRIVDLLNGGNSFLIFPEGKLTEDGAVGEFGRGTSIIVQRGGKPVVPISIDGTFQVLPKGGWKLYPRRVKVRIGKPVNFDKHHGDVDKETSEEVGKRLREIVVRLKDQG
jgi:1-acyl-sn-glycerol-3-phosphate acyltransferase